MKRMVQWKEIQEMAFEIGRTGQYLDENTRFYHTQGLLKPATKPLYFFPPRFFPFAPFSVSPSAGTAMILSAFVPSVSCSWSVFQTSLVWKPYQSEGVRIFFDRS
jgi:hypothetical protein